jgi:hypothetical protein
MKKLAKFTNQKEVNLLTFIWHLLQPYAGKSTSKFLMGGKMPPHDGQHQFWVKSSVSLSRSTLNLLLSLVND